MRFLFHYSPCVWPNGGENILFYSSFINLLIFYFSISFHILPFEKTTHSHHFFVVRRINYYCTLVNFQYFVKEILFLHFSWHLQKRHVSHWMQYIIINIFFQKTLKWIQYQHAFTIQIWVGVMQRPRSYQNKYCEPSYWSAYLSNID